MSESYHFDKNYMYSEKGDLGASSYDKISISCFFFEILDFSKRVTPLKLIRNIYFLSSSPEWCQVELPYWAAPFLLCIRSPYLWTQAVAQSWVHVKLQTKRNSSKESSIINNRCSPLGWLTLLQLGVTFNPSQSKWN
jgi:hypothetical protein